MQCPTVRVKSSHPDHELGFYVINESDLDEAVHEIWQDPDAKDNAEAMAEALKRADEQKAAYASRHVKETSR